ncbi:MAG TPA: hypothetical protein VMH36_23145 [Alphaproteobacteria bacterium]|nr:hypothetical protein [Alphaproteobacteria bacterium]
MDWGWGHVGVVFGLAGMAFGFTAMCFAFWRRYRREAATLEILRTYAQQGKEPPLEVAKLLQGGRSVYRRQRAWRNAILFACLAAALALIPVFSNGVRPHHGLVAPALIFTALAVWSALSALLLPKDDPR